MKTTSNGRRPQNIHLVGHTQTLNLCLDGQTIFYRSLQLRQPKMEDTSKFQKWNISATTYWIILKL